MGRESCTLAEWAAENFFFFFHSSIGDDAEGGNSVMQDRFVEILAKSKSLA